MVQGCRGDGNTSFGISSMSREAVLNAPNCHSGIASGRTMSTRKMRFSRIEFNYGHASIWHNNNRRTVQLIWNKHQTGFRMTSRISNDELWQMRTKSLWTLELNRIRNSHSRFRHFELKIRFLCSGCVLCDCKKPTVENQIPRVCQVSLHFVTFNLR